MANFELRILGPPALYSDGQEITLHSAKAMALLAYLVVEADAVHSREKLAALLWTDTPPRYARQSLRQALYSLRRALGPLAADCLLVTRTTVAFQPHSDLQVDLAEFLRYAAPTVADAATVDALRQAAERYRGSLLEGLDLADAAGLDEWLLLTRERLGQQAIHLLQATVDALLAAGDAGEARRLGYRLLALDNLNEGAHQRLLRALALQGDRDAVERHYRHCAEILMLELGVEPSPATTDLRDSLSMALTSTPDAAASTNAAAGRLPPALPAVANFAASLSFTFHGCEHELAELGRAFDQAMAGHSGLVAVAGEAGLGKTQLVHEFMRRTQTRARPPRWLYGQAHAAELGAPYTLWADALSPLSASTWRPPLYELPDVWRQQIARLIPALAQPTDAAGEFLLDLPTAENQLRLLQSVVQTLAHLARFGPLALFFDDVHWADRASLELLHYAARHLRRAPVLLICAYRPESVIDNLPLQTILHGADTTAVAVRPLKRTDIDEFLEELPPKVLGRLSASTQQGLAARLYAHCDGSRFMLVETVRWLAEQRQPAPVGEDAVWPIPPRVQELVHARLAKLGNVQRSLLAAVAVIGRPAEVGLLRQVSGQLELALLVQIDELVQRAFLAEAHDDAIPAKLAFSHAFIRQVVYAGLRPSRRQALHRRTAEALEKIHARHSAGVLEEIAYHYEQAGQPAAIDFLQQAAEQAVSLFALPHATDLISRALDLQAKLAGEEPTERFELLLTREALLDQQGRRAEQAADIAALLALAQGDERKLAVVGIREAGYLSSVRQPERSQTAANAALARYRSLGDGAGEARALRELGYLCWSTGAYGQALAYSRAALQLHRRQGDTLGEASALHNLAEIYRGLSSPRQALAHYEQALSLYWARQDQRRQALTLYGMAHALRQQGDLTAAQQCYARALAHCEATRDRLMLSRVHHALASLPEPVMDRAAAVAHLEQAVAISRAIGYAPGVAHGLLGLSYLHAQAGRPDAARTSLEDAQIWFVSTDDAAGLDAVVARLHQLDVDPTGMVEPPAQGGWVRGHITLSEGKVYCEFESPLAGGTSHSRDLGQVG